jgi:hypothetical protein
VGDTMAVNQNLRANRSWTDVLLAWLVEPETVTREELLEFSDATWDVIFQCATQHRILPLMAWQVNKLPQVAIPEQRIQALHTASRQSTLRQLAIARECVLIHQALESAGIPHLFLKGAFLSQACYPSPGLRPMRDIDVLVPKERGTETWKLLKDIGGDLDQYAHLGADEDYNLKHFPPLKSPSGACTVEIHRTVVPSIGNTVQFSRFLDRFWQRRSSYRIAGLDLPCPCLEDMLIHVVIHGVLDHWLNIGPLFVADLRFLVYGEHIDWDLVYREVCQLDIGRAMSLSLCLSGLEPEALKIGFHPPPPKTLESSKALLCQNIDFRSEIAVSATFNRNTLAETFIFFGIKLFPNKRSLQTWIGINRPDQNKNQIYFTSLIYYYANLVSRLKRVATNKQVKVTAFTRHEVKNWVNHPSENSSNV